MDEIIDVLKSMGAENVTFRDQNGDNDLLQFEYKGKIVTIEGRAYNDGLGAIDGTVKPKCQ